MIELRFDSGLVARLNWYEAECYKCGLFDQTQIITCIKVISLEECHTRKNSFSHCRQGDGTISLLQVNKVPDVRWGEYGKRFRDRRARQ